jgi:methyl-accepting chemotaxis protein
MKNLSFRFKLAAAFILLVLCILAFITFLVFEVSLLRQKSELRERILGLAKISALFVDTGKLMGIKPELSSQYTQPYKDIKLSLEKIRRTDPLIDSVYTMIKSDKENILVFMVDSGDKRGVAAHCSELYDVSKLPQMQKAFDGPAVDKEMTADKWGVFLSGYAPLYDSRGKAVAIIGLDVKADSIRNMQYLLARGFFLVFIFVVIIAVAISWFIAKGVTRPLKILTLGVKEVGKGNLEKKVELRSGDEFELLALSFNKMVDELKEWHLRLKKYYLDTIRTLARAIEAKDPYTKGHSERVAQYAVGLARQMRLPEEDIRLLEEVSILHDIGKIGIPEDILTKPTMLTKEEWDLVKEHPSIGVDILSSLEFLTPGITVILRHHERQDGKGYPQGISGKGISLLTAILSVADAYDAMTSDRSYRKAFSKEEAIKRLKADSGLQFNRDVIEAFIRFLGETGK